MNYHHTPLYRCVAAVALLCIGFATPPAVLANESVEELFERAEPEGNAEELVGLLHDLRMNPVQLNLASEEQLLRLPLLTPADAARIVQWRQRQGPIGSAVELEAVIGSAGARRVAQYFTFETAQARSGKKAADQFKGSVINRVFWEVPPRLGIENGKYAGDNRRVYNRVQAGTSNYGVSFVQESDIGEPRFGDFLSFSVHAEQLGILSQAVVGDYRLSFGQGLLFGQGRYFSKGTDAVDGVLLFSPALRPYTSAAEENFLQGAAVTLSPGPFEITAFKSHNKVDATIDGGVVTSLSSTGYHRTAYEIAKKDDLSQDVQGFNLRYKYRHGDLKAGIGATLASYRYGLPLEWLGGLDQGRRLGSVEASVVYRAVQVFGEAAGTRAPDALSWICGVQADLGQGITGVASMRQYAVGYYSPFAGVFAERGGDGADEEGFYLGLKARVLDNLNVGASYDIFRFPELSSTYALPSSGHDARLYTTWRQSSAMTWDALYQHKQKEETAIQNDAGEVLEYVMPVPKTTNRVQLGLKTRLTSVLTLKTKGEYKSVESRYIDRMQRDDGWLLYGQLDCTLGTLALKTRFTRFDTDSYDAALYSYEDDLPLVYSLNSYSGRGKAMFAMVSYEAAHNFRLSAKYETTWYGDRKVCGTGNDQRATSSPSSFHVGCMLKF
ncbi:MAG: helix-hairpin-helix domain-containing protein [Chlorobiaceae bacterium]|nr:helix-hairpin-helix domain-containing protein [Chlorobiaceae bacterium]